MSEECRRRRHVLHPAAAHPGGVGAAQGHEGNLLAAEELHAAEAGVGPLEGIQRTFQGRPCISRPIIYSAVFMMLKVLGAFFMNLHSLPFLPLSPLECKF